jgi:hypothetical protein
MEIILELLQDSAIISNVISIVVLGVLGVITRLIINSIGSINAEKGQLLAARTSYERIDRLAHMQLLQAKLYKDAIIGSNLPATTKSAVLEDFSKLQDAYKGFVENEVVAPVAVVKEEIKPTIIEQAVKAAGQDVLSKLREQLEQK